MVNLQAEYDKMGESEKMLIHPSDPIQRPARRSPVPRHTVPLSDRFWPKVNKTESCWIWTASATTSGYGLIGLASGKMKLATHVSWFLRHGHWPKFIRHSCDNPPCVNPDHLFEGNHKLNAQDRESKQRGRRPPDAFHARGESVNHAKLTADIVLQIRSLHSSAGLSAAKLGAKFGVHENTVRDIINRKTWKHI